MSVYVCVPRLECVREGTSNLSAGHSPWSNTEHAQQHLIALWVVEPILLPMLQHASCIRSTEVMQHRRRIRCELFSGG